MNSDRIEKQIELKAPIARVWRALTHHVEFGHWFGVALETPFISGQTSRGRITHPGYEHLTMEVAVIKMQPLNFFAFKWHPYAVDPKVDYAQEASTVVEFHLTEITGGTLLSVSESGFDRLPASRRAEAFRMNDDGWAEQMKNIQNHVTKN